MSKELPEKTDQDHVGRLGYSYRRNLHERFIESILFLSASLSVIIMLAIIVMLVKESVIFFQHVSIWEFLTDTQWTPLFNDAHYGIFTACSRHIGEFDGGTVSGITVRDNYCYLLVRILPLLRCVRLPRPFLELLGGIPTVVYGYFALLFVDAFVANDFSTIAGF